MYLPDTFAETDEATLFALVREHPFATWIVTIEGRIVANHLPLQLDEERRALVGHVARANPVWKGLEDGGESLVVFQGPEHYITPSWYPSKHAHGKAVPTWNYAVVHCRGRARVVDDADFLRAHLGQLTERHESGQALPWKLEDAPADYLRQMMSAIIAIEIPIVSLTGKWKVSQNRQAADRLGVVAGLTSDGSAEALAMAELVGQRAAPR